MSTITEILLEKFSSDVITEVQANQTDVYFLVDVSAIKDVIRFVRKDERIAMNYLSDISAVDYPERTKRFDVNYVLFSVKHNERLHLKTMVSENDTIESISDIWEGAYYTETEVYDLFGIRFQGNKFERRLFMPADYIGFPLRKDFVSPWEDITFK